MRTWLAVLAGLTLIIVGTGVAGAEVAFLLGIGLFGYNVAVLASLALHDSIERLADLFEAWAEWEPMSAGRHIAGNINPSAWYGRPRESKSIGNVHMDKTEQNASAWYGRPEQYQLSRPLGQFKLRSTWHYANQTKAQSLLEYALILALVFVIAVVALAIFGEGLAELFDNTVGALKEVFLG